MLGEIKRRIGQLSTAADLLDFATPSHARLALFLVDNVAELLVDKRMRFLFWLDDLRQPSDEPLDYAYPIAGRLGIGEFKDKVNLLVRREVNVPDTFGEVTS